MPEDVVVEGAERLGREERQEAPLAEEFELVVRHSVQPPQGMARSLAERLDLRAGRRPRWEGMQLRGPGGFAGVDDEQQLARATLRIQRANADAARRRLPWQAKAHGAHAGMRVAQGMPRAAEDLAVVVGIDRPIHGRIAARFTELDHEPFDIGRTARAFSIHPGLREPADGGEPPRIDAQRRPAFAARQAGNAADIDA